jgi:hypothetical protein
MEGCGYRQVMPSKGLAAKIVQCKGLREGLEGEIGGFARHCVDFPGRSWVITKSSWALLLQVRPVWARR